MSHQSSKPPSNEDKRLASKQDLTTSHQKQQAWIYNKLSWLFLPLLMTLIDWYQKHISPRKNYQCACRTHKGELSCSAHAKQVLQSESFNVAIGKILARRQACQKIAREHGFSYKKLYIRSGMAVVALSALTGCCLGGDSCRNRVDKNAYDDKDNQPKVGNIAQTELKEDVVIVDNKISNTIKSIKTTEGNNITFNLPINSPILDKIKKDEVLQLPPSDELPFGYAGVVTEKSSNGTVALRPAMVEEVYKRLNVDFDSRIDNATIVGVIQTNPNITFDIGEDAQQVGVLSFPKIDKKNCAGEEGFYNSLNFLVHQGAKLNEILKYNKNEDVQSASELNYNIPYGNSIANINFKSNCKILSEQKDKNFKRFGSNFTARFTVSKKDSKGELFGEVNLKDIVMVIKAIYDEKNHGWQNLENYMSGKISSSVGFRTKDSKTSVVMPSISELLLDTNDKKQKTIWDSLTIGPGFANISGLDGKDKQGLFPLGGVIISLASHPFVGNPLDADIKANSVASVILWLYIRADGKVVVKGQVLGEMEETPFKRGASFYSDGKGGLDGKVYDDTTYPFNPVFKMGIKGEADFKHQLGVTPALDLLVGGVRPLTVQMDAIKYKLDAKITGEGAWLALPRKLPAGRSEFEGNACISTSLGVLSELIIKSNIQANINILGFKRTVGAGWNGNFPHKWMEDKEFKKCIEDTSLTVNFTQDSTYDSTKDVQYYVDYQTAYNANKNNPLIDSWRVKVENERTKEQKYHILSQNNPKQATFKLPYGDKYKVKLVAYSNTYYDVATSKKQSIDLTTDFSKTKVNKVIINPASPTVNSQYQVTVMGVNLFANEMIKITGCHNQQLISATLAQHVYQCTAPNMPVSQLLTIKTPDGKKTLFSTSFEVVKGKPTQPTTSKLTATGITWCSDAHTNMLECSLQILGKDWYGLGQDGEIQAGKSMSYEVLTRNGETCVKDKVTGLIWEQKTDDGGLRDKDNTYTWYNPDNSKNGWFAGLEDIYDQGYSGSTTYGETCNNTLNKCNTQAYIQALNNANYCGYSDWRLPKREELRSIVDYGRYKPPAINTQVFPNTQQSKFYWSSSPTANRSYNGHAWGMSFFNGNISYTFKPNYVRAVRSE